MGFGEGISIIKRREEVKNDSDVPGTSPRRTSLSARSSLPSSSSSPPSSSSFVALPLAAFDMFCAGVSGPCGVDADAGVAGVAGAGVAGVMGGAGPVDVVGVVGVAGPVGVPGALGVPGGAEEGISPSSPSPHFLFRVGGTSMNAEKSGVSINLNVITIRPEAPRTLGSVWV